MAPPESREPLCEDWSLCKSWEDKIIFLSGDRLTVGYILASKTFSMIFLKIYIFLNFIYLFIYLWLCWVFVSVRGLSPVAASRGHSSSRCAGLSLSRPLLLRSTGSRRASSVIVAHGPSCSVACGIFPDQGSNPCPLHWQADSQPLRHQGSPLKIFFNVFSFFWYYFWGDVLC